MCDRQQDEWLTARIRDAVRRSEHRPCFVGFLDEREATIARRAAQECGCGSWRLWGGYEESERVVFGAFPDYLAPEPESFPIAAITAEYRPCDELTHRDFLGAFLAAGVQRATLGDILPGEGRCVLFVREENAPFFLTQIEKVGRVGVTLRAGYEEPLPQGKGFALFEGVIASARLDCVVAAATHRSREKAARMITAGFVSHNHEPSLSVSTEVREGDRLSIRGCGRYIVDRLGPVTKKGRIGIAGRKYL